nr:unconventional myosin-IXa-like [Salvelinus alpinus]
MRRHCLSVENGADLYFSGCVYPVCRYACHRKCCLKLTTKCSKKYDPELSSRQFGVEVSRLTNEERTVPLVVEKLINYIEMHGLYTEGIYRKSGSTNKIKELKQGLDTDVNNMNLDDYNIHVIASVFKQWLRDLPNPLMTFELYEEFLRAMCKYSYLPVILISDKCILLTYFIYVCSSTSLLEIRRAWAW